MCARGDAVRREPLPADKPESSNWLIYDSYFSFAPARRVCKVNREANTHLPVAKAQTLGAHNTSYIRSIARRFSRA